MSITYRELEHVVSASFSVETRPYSITIEIPTADTSANKTKGQNKFVVHNLYKNIKKEMALLCRNKQPEYPLENFKLSITRHGVKCLDYDNLISSFKPYIDALTLSGIIKNDSWKYIRQINTDQKISTEKKLVITVEDCSDSRMATKEELAELFV